MTNPETRARLEPTGGPQDIVRSGVLTGAADRMPSPVPGVTAVEMVLTKPTAQSAVRFLIHFTDRVLVGNVSSLSAPGSWFINAPRRKAG